MQSAAASMVDNIVAGGEGSRFLLNSSRSPIPNDPFSKLVAKEIRRRGL